VRLSHPGRGGPGRDHRLQLDMAPRDETPTLAFASPKAWETWLARNHAKSSGIWLQIYKKGLGPALRHLRGGPRRRALLRLDRQPEASQGRGLPGCRGSAPGAPWRLVADQHAARRAAHRRGPDEAGRPCGSGGGEGGRRWQRAYDSPSAATVPADFLKELAKDKKAQSFFEGLNRANVYAIAYRLQTAKKPGDARETMKVILAMLARGESFH
jgi:hypothetical protein